MIKPEPAVTLPYMPPCGQMIFTTLGDALLAASATKLRDSMMPCRDSLPS